MAKYLISVCEKYRVDTEEEALKLIEAAKSSSTYELTKYSTQKKNKKQKGEIYEEWVQVTLTKVFDDEKDPTGCAAISYNRSAWGDSEDEN